VIKISERAKVFILCGQKKNSREDALATRIGILFNDMGNERKWDYKS
jgi:hypothetical protein